jgi:hypothetical protein
LKQAFYDGRIRAPAHAKALHELVTLELDVKKNKIDHPPNGSKDVSDSMAGVAWGLTQRRELWFRHGVAARHVPQALLRKPEAEDEFAKRAARQEASGSYMDRLRAERLQEAEQGAV